MKCENCGKNEANFVYRSSINGRTEEHHLCRACAEKLGYTYTVRGTTDAAQLETMVTELSIIPVDDELEEFQVLFLSELDDSNS